MVGYSEVLQVIGAMVIFSLILMSATNMIKRNTHMQVEGAMEREVIAVAQDIIEEARTQDFDEVTVDAALPPSDIPGDFTSPTNLGCDSGEDPNTRADYDDFDDYNCLDETVETEHGEFSLSAEVFYVTPNRPHEKTNSQSSFKKIRVLVTSKYLTGGSGDETLYNFEFVRNYYAD